MWDFVPFWRDLNRYRSAIALIEASSGRSWSYEELADQTADLASSFRSEERGVVLLPLDNAIRDVVLYIAVLQSGNVPLLYSENTSSQGLLELIASYKPKWVVGRATSFVDNADYLPSYIGEYAIARSSRASYFVNERLALLVSTSGSSGASKVVRLSAENVRSNAIQIALSLTIQGHERAVTVLPLSYVYGLSVLHSHLLVGASVLVDSKSIIERAFWSDISAYAVSSFSGVPWTYQTMRKLGIRRGDVTSIRKYTTAGAKMDDGTAQWMLDDLTANNQIYFMYGQTEATARMSVLPAEFVQAKRGSVGKAVSRGKFSTASDGSILFEGPNVMLGYAEKWSDLERGDDLNGRLETGDLGFVDQDGFLFITGRKSRECKIYGMRANLDAIASFAQEQGVTANVLQRQADLIEVQCELAGDENHQILAHRLAVRFGLPLRAFAIYPVNKLQRLASGKLAS